MFHVFDHCGTCLLGERAGIKSRTQLPETKQREGRLSGEGDRPERIFGCFIFEEEAGEAVSVHDLAVEQLLRYREKRARIISGFGKKHHLESSTQLGRQE